MRKYCDECGRDVETTIITKKETYDVCGETIEVDAQVLVCADCGEEFCSEELDNATLVSAYNEYRRRHKLLLPEEIKKIREQYGLSQRSFAKLLNWGDKTICRYENGSIQDKAHNSLLLFLRKPENMRTYLTENEVTLTQRQLGKLLDTVDKLEQNEEYRSSRRIFRLYFGGAPSEENGISISGIRYAHLPYGPVPENFDILLGTMAADHIAYIEVFYDNGYEKHQVIPEEELPDGILTEDELGVMERIYQKFSNYGSVDISNYSHKEKGYRETRKGEIISYAYAKDIELN